MHFILQYWIYDLLCFHFHALIQLLQLYIVTLYDIYIRICGLYIHHEYVFYSSCFVRINYLAAVEYNESLFQQSKTIHCNCAVDCVVYTYTDSIYLMSWANWAYVCEMYSHMWKMSATVHIILCRTPSTIFFHSHHLISIYIQINRYTI